MMKLLTARLNSQFNRHRSPLTLLKWLALAGVFISIAGTIHLFIGRDSAILIKQKKAGNGTIEEPVIVEHDGGSLKWKLRARKAVRGLNSTHLLQATLELYDQAGIPILIRGDEAWFDPLKRSARFAGHVRIDYQSWRVQSSRATFDSAAGRVYLPDAFTVQGIGVRARGSDLVIDKRQQRIWVRKHIWIEDSRAHKETKRK
ncbi:MAG: hypothetical protein Q9M26_04765 [Mariprofundales bacterium]|nr:hypothetical protein [Mariprofundales bacterium]